MQGFIKHRRLVFLLVAAFAAALAAGMIYKTGTGSKSLPVIKPAPDFVLEDAYGKEIALSRHDGKVRLVYFFFASCPDVCYPTNFILSKVEDELAAKGLLGKDAVMYSISFDPERDTPEKLKQYAASLNADKDGWFFLRGEQNGIIELAEKYGVSVIKGKQGQYAHQNIVTLVDRSGNIRKFFNASQADLDHKEVVETIERLSKE